MESLRQSQPNKKMKTPNERVSWLTSRVGDVVISTRWDGKREEFYTTTWLIEDEGSGETTYTGDDYEYSEGWHHYVFSQAKDIIAVRES